MILIGVSAASLRELGDKMDHAGRLAGYTLEIRRKDIVGVISGWNAMMTDDPFFTKPVETITLYLDIALVPCDPKPPESRSTRAFRLDVKPTSSPRGSSENDDYC